MRLDEQHFSRCACCSSSQANDSDIISAMSRMASHTLMTSETLFCRSVWLFSNDNSPKLKGAASNKLMVHLTSTLHRPQSNGLIEWYIQLMIDKARFLLKQSGLPLRYWTLAARALCHGRNVCLAAFYSETLWKAKHGHEFTGALTSYHDRRSRHRCAQM